MFWQGDHQNALSLNNVNEVREIKLSDNRSFIELIKGLKQLIGIHISHDGNISPGILRENLINTILH